MAHQLVIILDFGGQYNQLIARRVRDLGVYCEVHSYKTDLEKIKQMHPAGIIFTGGPNSVYLEESPKCDPAIFEMGIPILGICYGNQLMAHLLGGEVKTGDSREYGKTDTIYNTECVLFHDLPKTAISWMSHTDYISKLPAGFTNAAHTAHCPNAAMASNSIRKYPIPKMETSFYAGSSMTCAGAMAIGTWKAMQKLQLKKPVQKLETGKFCWLCPAAWTLLWLLRFSPVLLATN